MVCNKKLYSYLNLEIRNVLNKIDPENFEPGHPGGSPIGEYDMEVLKLVNVILHNWGDTKKLSLDLITKMINDLWQDSFDKECHGAKEIALELLILIRSIQNEDGNKSTRYSEGDRQNE